MKISIVTISFNQAKFLRACIESVLSQNYPELEYIVVDPGSSDGSREIIESYGSRLIPVFESDSGAANGLNNGFSLATGAVFGFINSDDCMLPNSLEAIREGFRTHPSCGILLGPGLVIDHTGAAVRRIHPTSFTPRMYLYGAVTVFQQGTFFRAAEFREAGGFNENNRTCWDGELFLAMTSRGVKCAKVGSPLAAFRIHPDSITGSGRLSSLYYQDSERLFQQYMGRPRNSLDRVVGHLARLYKLGIRVVSKSLLIAPRSSPVK